MNEREIAEAEQKLREARHKLRVEQTERQYADALALCERMTTQEWWKRKTHGVSEYDNVAYVTFYRMRELTPTWWSPLEAEGKLGEPTLSIDGRKGRGTVDAVWLPITPTLVASKTITPTARALGTEIVLKVSPATKKDVEGAQRSWLAYPNNLIIPVNVTAAPILQFSEKPEWFDDLIPSSAEEFERALKLVLNFVTSVQEAFYPELETSVK